MVNVLEGVVNDRFVSELRLEQNSGGSLPTVRIAGATWKGSRNLARSSVILESSQLNALSIISFSTLTLCFPQIMLKQLA